MHFQSKKGWNLPLEGLIKSFEILTSIPQAQQPDLSINKQSCNQDFHITDRQVLSTTKIFLGIYHTALVNQ